MHPLGRFCSQLTFFIPESIREARFTGLFASANLAAFALALAKFLPKVPQISIFSISASIRTSR
jgi:hypothetical protein